MQTESRDNGLQWNCVWCEIGRKEGLTLQAIAIYTMHFTKVFVQKFATIRIIYTL